MATIIKPHAQPICSYTSVGEQSEGRAQERLSEFCSMKELCNKYIDSLSEKERLAYHIAKSHLGSSFSLEKSKGFIEWKRKDV